MAHDLAIEKFGIGQPVPRNEDPVLLRGEGRYTDDVNLPGQLHAAMVRSRHAHGVIRSIDLDAARAMPGVRAVYGAADVAAYGTLKCNVAFTNRDGSPMRKPPRPILAAGKLRYVGEPVACVIADTAAQAKDAAEAVAMDVDALTAVTRALDAAQPGAPQVHDDGPGNVSLDYHYGEADKVAAAFAAAAHVTRLPLVNNRVVVSPLEPRAAVAAYDPAAGRFTINIGSQGVFGLRAGFADVLKLPVEKVRVLTGNVGGSFGMKAAVYPEYVCLAHGARLLGRPVKWTDERAESFISDHHGRDQEIVGELALDQDGNFLAVRITGYANSGAYLTGAGPLPQTFNIVKNVIGV